MIGHYLLSLTPEQEARLLTRRFGPLYGAQNRGAGDDFRCLVMCALDEDMFMGACVRLEETGRGRGAPAFRYEDLCKRFHMDRVNAAIRHRILANQARRVLTRAREAINA
jgi:hypothetical protein